MDRTPDSTYEGYDIYTLVIPLHDHRWLATSEIQRESMDGPETFQEFGGPCYGRTRDDAHEAVLADTRHKIKDLVARP